MTRPQISIDRASKRFAIFDNYELVYDFTPYTSEQVALDFAKDWLKARTDIEPEIIYPRITKIKMSY